MPTTLFSLPSFGDLPDFNEIDIQFIFIGDPAVRSLYFCLGLFDSPDDGDLVSFFEFSHQFFVGGGPSHKTRHPGVPGAEADILLAGISGLS